MAAFNFILSESARNLIRNRGSFVLSTIVQAICLLLFSLFVLITINIFRFIGGAQRRIEVYAFLHDKAERTSLMENIRLLRGVADVRYVSKEEALAELKAELRETTSMVEVLGKNPLPASFRIQLEPGSRTLEELERIEEKISVLPGIREVWSGKEIIRRLAKAVRLVIGIDIALLVIVAISIVFISFQTVESTILLRSREIEIMRLVGASESTVRSPFILEGLVQGFVGGIIASLLVTAFYQITAVQTQIIVFPYLTVFVTNIVFGCILGLIGSHIALSRILK